MSVSTTRAGLFPGQKSDCFVLLWLIFQPMTDRVANSSDAGSTDLYNSKPWISLYSEGLPKSIRPEFPDALSMFRAAVERAPKLDAVRYFDQSLSYRRLDRLSDSFAVWLLHRG